MIFTGAVSLGVLVLIAIMGWFLVQGATWPVAPIILTIVYGVGAVLFRLESSLRYPIWLAQAVGALAEFWPPIKWLRTSGEVQSQNEAIIGDFNRTLEEYLLDEFDSKRSEELARHIFLLSTRTLAVAWAKERPEAPEGEPPVPSADALELLHHERSNQTTIHVWQARGEGLIDELVPLVRRSPRVPTPGPYTDEDVRTLLGALRDFDLELLAEELLAVNRIGGRLQRYAEFLAPGGASRVPDVTSLIVGQELGELPAGSSTLFRLESPAETVRLMAAIEDCDDEALGDVHRGIFLAERDIDAGPLKKRACAVLFEPQPPGGTDPIRVLQAYLWEKDQREKGRRGGAITVAELDSHWEEWSGKAREELGAGFNADLNQLAERLEAGIWPTRRAIPGTDIAYPPPQAALVSEHEEVRDLDAYLITFDERHGPLGTLVDGLKKPGSIYRFGPYTRNTRLGIVPHGMPFHEFVDHLLADLDDALHHYSPGFGSDGAGDDGALRFTPGRPRSILLKHDHKCEGPVTFEISEPLRRCNRDGKVAPQTAAAAADGQLGEIEAWPGRPDRGLVRYFPESVEKPRRVCFTCTSACPHQTRRRTVQLSVGAKGQESRLDQIELTVNRVDLAHCRELWFGDPALRTAMRAPSIYDVWQEVEPELDRDEKEPVKAAFERFLVN